MSEPAAIDPGALVAPSNPVFKLAEGDVVAQWVECRPRDPMDPSTRGSNPVRSTRNICEFFRVKMFC